MRGTGTQNSPEAGCFVRAQCWWGTGANQAAQQVRMRGQGSARGCAAVGAARAAGLCWYWALRWMCEARRVVAGARQLVVLAVHWHAASLELPRPACAAQGGAVNYACGGVIYLFVYYS